MPTEVDWDVSRRCEITYQSRHQVSGGPVERGAFNVMVFRSDGLGIPERERRRVAGAGPETFKHQQVFYVTKGDYAVSLTDFNGTVDSRGDENAGRPAPHHRRRADQLPWLPLHPRLQRDRRVHHELALHQRPGRHRGYSVLAAVAERGSDAGCHRGRRSTVLEQPSGLSFGAGLSAQRRLPGRVRQRIFPVHHRPHREDESSRALAHDRG